jgi:hypothetical protein
MTIVPVYKMTIDECVPSIITLKLAHQFFFILISSELGKYPVSAKIKDWQCSTVAIGIGCLYGLNRKEEMRPVYIRQTSMLKFQDRLTAEVRR